MNIEKQPRDDHQITLIVEFEAGFLEGFKRKAARKIAQQIKIPGFRPGKAPYDVIRRSVGEGQIVNEAVELMVEDMYPEILKTAEIDPGGPGNVEEIISLDPPKIEFLIPLSPSIELCDYAPMRKDYEEPVVTEKDLNDFLYNSRANSGTFTPVERPIEEGDLVTLKMGGTYSDPVGDEDLAALEEGPMQLVIEPEERAAEQEWPYKGFARQLIGLAPASESTFSHLFNEDVEEAKLKGRLVDIKVKIDSVKKMEVPPLDDEYAKTMGYENVADLHAAVQRRLEVNKKSEYDQDFFNGLLDEIIATSTIKYPPQALIEEIGIVMDSIEGDLKRNNLDKATFLKIRQMDEEQYTEEVVKPIAIKRLTRGLVMRELSRTEKLALDTKQLEMDFNLTLSQLTQSGNLKDMRSKWSDEEIANMVAMESSQKVMNRQVLARLKAIVTGHGDDQPEAVDDEPISAGEEQAAVTNEETEEITSQPEA